jgi:hypothetical protein
MSELVHNFEPHEGMKERMQGPWMCKCSTSDVEDDGGDENKARRGYNDRISRPTALEIGFLDAICCD